MGQPRPLSWNSQSKPLVFFIGRGSHGNWFVQDQHHLCGGLFVDRAEALRFARFENGHGPETVIMVSGIFNSTRMARRLSSIRSRFPPMLLASDELTDSSNDSPYYRWSNVAVRVPTRSPPPSLGFAPPEVPDRRRSWTFAQSAICEPRSRRPPRAKPQ